MPRSSVGRSRDGGGLGEDGPGGRLAVPRCDSRGMPRLIVLNGPPASGKSTLAQRYAEDHPLALNLDIDRVRALIGGWRDDPHSGGMLARAIALAAARVHLAGGHDVVIPQFLGRPEFLERVEELAREAGASFHEIVLMDSKDNVLRRFAERGRRTADPFHVEAQVIIDRSGGAAELAAMYDRLVDLVATRPVAQVIPSIDGRPDETYRRLVDCLTAR